MNRRDLLAAVAIATPVVLAAGTTSTAEAAVTNPGLVIRNLQGKAGSTRSNLNSTFQGKVRITRVSIDQQTRTLKVTGRIDGTVRKPNGSTVAINERRFVADAELTGGAGAGGAEAKATCPILNLNIGRITLNLLGLFIDLAPVSLVISALSGAGALLGNLLCALVGLLDSPRSLLNSILSLLQQINTILGNNRIPAG